MKIELSIPDDKVQELLNTCFYVGNTEVTIDMLKKAARDGLFNIYKTGAILKARGNTKPVIDEGIIEVK